MSTRSVNVTHLESGLRNPFIHHRTCVCANEFDVDGGGDNDDVGVVANGCGGGGGGDGGGDDDDDRSSVMFHRPKSLTCVPI